MEQIDITQHGRSISRIVIGDGLRLDRDFGACLKAYRNVFVVADASVVQKSRVVAALQRDLEQKSVPVKLIEASETLKTMDTVLEISSWLLENGADRDALVLAIGGGITTDMAGFAASIYKRGTLTNDEDIITTSGGDTPMVDVFDW